jgi:lipopolysaccharide transport system permease protein
MKTTIVSPNQSTQDEEEFLQRLAETAQEIIIRPSRGWVALNLRDIWVYRELLYFLTWRDIKVRYKQTYLGAAWAILQPVLTMVLFSVIFGRLAGLDSEGQPYPVFTFAALLPWQLFAFALTQSSNSLVNSQHLITKIYFPRLIIPLSSVLAGLVDFAISMVVLAFLMVFYRIPFTSRILLLPVLVLLAMATAMAIGLWLSALNVKYRDVRHTVPFLAQFWLFATPVAYSITLIPEKWRVIYSLNPMAGVVEGFRWALLGKSNEVGVFILVSAVVVLLLFSGGLIYFKRMEDGFADVI